MKALIISILILVVIISGISLNAVWVRRSLNEITEITEELNAENISLLEEKWKKAYKVLSFSAHRVDLRVIDDEVRRAALALEDGDIYELLSARSSILSKVEDLLSAQCFDLKTII